VRVSLQQTLNIQPDFSEALFWSAQSHWVEAGDLDSGRLAVEAVPVGLNDGWVAMTRFLQPTLSRDPEAALATLETFDEERINFMPMAFPASFFSGWARIQMGLETEARDDLQAAVTYLEAMLDQAPDDYTAMPSLGLAYAMLGRSDDALAVGHRAVELYGMDRDRFFGLNVEIHVAWIEVLVGEHEAAIDRLVRVLAVPNLYLSAAKLRLDPIWDPLRDNPRFAALIED